MATGAWLNAAQIAADWGDDAPDKPLLDRLVGAARSDCRHYAVVPIDTLDTDDEAQADLISSFHMAQLMQTRNTWNASRVDADGGMGDGDFVIRPFPLDWQVKAKLRPKGGIPVIG